MWLCGYAAMRLCGYASSYVHRGVQLTYHLGIFPSYGHTVTRGLYLDSHAGYCTYVRVYPRKRSTSPTAKGAKRERYLSPQTFLRDAHNFPTFGVNFCSQKKKKKNRREPTPRAQKHAKMG
ncbi:hypothetical protein POVWA2_020110 [Plasmodium ovale wallikeri]|uniref:Uncharacterized protein n=1 Tax=Plasmodium ovale wallikeri TaxID=864142 RepID=A0A1A8YR63_PLAOA|nr:hypothetical protein POVWA1_019920 [Plasmodium ovale wallikeri]SBT34522.1 hypothetical protein POVWA2_020110 [Plasmodium ovale wallikeri]